ncbi:uncharacterized protein J5F26_002328 isoform 1-T1 [Ciconia maguari]
MTIPKTFPQETGVTNHSEEGGKKKKKARKKPGCNSSFQETLQALFFLKLQFSGKRPPLRAELGAQGSPRALLPCHDSTEGGSPEAARGRAGPRQTPAPREQVLILILPPRRTAPPPHAPRGAAAALNPRLPLHNRSPPPPHAPQRLSPAGRAAVRKGRWGGRGEGGFAAGGRSLPGLLPPFTILALRLSAAAGGRTPPRRRLSPTARGSAGAPPRILPPSLGAEERLPGGVPSFAGLLPRARSNLSLYHCLDSEPSF